MKALEPEDGWPRSVTRFSKTGLRSAIEKGNVLTSDAEAMRYALTTGAQIKMQKVNAARATAVTFRAELVSDALTIGAQVKMQKANAAVEAQGIALTFRAERARDAPLIGEEMNVPTVIVAVAPRCRSLANSARE
jgi:hypothetical protein